MNELSVVTREAAFGIGGWALDHRDRHGSGAISSAASPQSAAARGDDRHPPRHLAASRVEPYSTLPPPSKVLSDSWELIADPFYDRGGLDKGCSGTLPPV